MDKSAIDSWAAALAGHRPRRDPRGTTSARIPLGADDRAHAALHAGHREPHGHLRAPAPRHARHRRSRRRQRSSPAGSTRRRSTAARWRACSSAAARVTRRATALAADAHAPLEERAMGAVARAWPDFVGRAHGLGRDQRAHHPHRLPASGRARAASRPGASCSDASCATSRGTSPSTTTRPSAGSAARRARRVARLLVDRFWAPGGERGAAGRRGALSRRLPLRRARRARRRAQDRRDHPPAARLRGRRARRGVARRETRVPRWPRARRDRAGRWRQRRVPRDSCEAQPIPNAPSSTSAPPGPGLRAGQPRDGPRGPRGQQSDAARR